MSDFKGVLTILEDEESWDEQQSLMNLFNEGISNFEESLNDLKEVIHINLSNELPKEFLN